MAINFLNSVDLNQNQLIKAAIESQPNDAAAGTGVDGQLYYDTTLDKVKVWTGAAWESISGDITSLTEGTYINIDNPLGPIPTINHDLTTRTDTTSTDAPAYGGTFEAVTSVTTNTTGHVTTIDVSTITIPDDTNETYTLPVTAGTVSPGAPTSGKISLTAGGTGSGVKSTVEFIGTTSRIDITSVNQNNGSITIDLTDDVTIVDDLTVGGTIIQSQTGETNYFSSPLDMNTNKLERVATGTVATDGVNLGQVEQLVAGLGSFQGGYDAATNTPALSGASNVAVGNGDFYVVTAAGTLFTKDLEVGDMIFANTDIAANSTPVESNYTYVIADANIAGAGATDGATEKGVAGFDSAHFDVSATGWVQLNSQRNPYGAKQSLNETSPCSKAEAGGVTTFTIDLADATLFGTGALSENVKVEITDGAAPYQTVFAEVTRSGSASMAIAFTGSIANDAYQVLLTYI